MLVCSDNVYEDGDLTKVPENDEKWQDRDHTALVYGDTYVRLWDMWTGRPIATIALNTGKNKHSGDMPYNLMPGTEYVSLAHSFASLRLRLRPAHGDEGDYDVSEKYIAYTTKLPELPEAQHDKKNIRSSILSRTSLPTEPYRYTSYILLEPEAARVKFGTIQRACCYAHDHHRSGKES
jgi:hypothetical protein